MTELEVCMEIRGVLRWHASLAGAVLDPPEKPWFIMPDLKREGELLREDSVSTHGFLSRKVHVATNWMGELCRTTMYLTGPKIVANMDTWKGGRVVWTMEPYGNVFGKGKQLRENELAFYRDVKLLLKEIAGDME